MLPVGIFDHKRTVSILGGCCEMNVLSTQVLSVVNDGLDDTRLSEWTIDMRIHHRTARTVLWQDLNSQTLVRVHLNSGLMHVE